MRVPCRVAIRRGDKIEYVEAVVWIDELPPDYRRGRKQKMNTRKYKRARQVRSIEEEATPSQVRRLVGMGRPASRGSGEETDQPARTPRPIIKARRGAVNHDP